MTDINPHDVLASLGVEGVVDCQPITGGWDARVWKFQTPGGDWHGLRVYQQSDRAEGAKRERSALEAAAAAGLPVPRVERFGTWNGLPATVLSWAPGSSMGDAIADAPWRIFAMGTSFGRLQAKLHTVRAPDELRASAPGYWLQRGDAVDFPVSKTLPTTPTCDSLVHLDFHPLNVVVDRGNITGLVDWTNAAAGDPRADVARTIVLLRLAPIPPHPMKAALQVARSLLYLSWRRGYVRQAGALPDTAPYMTWAGVTLLKDMEPRLNQAGVWADQRDVERIRRWVERTAHGMP